MKKNAAEFVTELAEYLVSQDWNVELTRDESLGHFASWTTVRFYATSTERHNFTTISGQAIKSTRKGSRWQFDGVRIYTFDGDDKHVTKYSDAKISVQTYGKNYTKVLKDATDRLIASKVA